LLAKPQDSGFGGTWQQTPDPKKACKALRVSTRMGIIDYHEPPVELLLEPPTEPRV
jgi:hypothetical protein